MASAGRGFCNTSGKLLNVESLRTLEPDQAGGVPRGDQSTNRVVYCTLYKYVLIVVCAVPCRDDHELS